MIRYTLRCDDGHAFESWFASSAAYDALETAGQLACAVCGSAAVSKALMTPAVAAPGRSDPAAAPDPAPMTTALSAPVDSRVARALAALRAEIEAKADYVGPRFAQEARRIHAGEAEERAIWGQATGEEARALVEDGVPVAPLPFFPRRDD